MWGKCLIHHEICHVTPLWWSELWFNWCSTKPTQCLQHNVHERLEEEIIRKTIYLFFLIWCDRVNVSTTVPENDDIYFTSAKCQCTQLPILVGWPCQHLENLCSVLSVFNSVLICDVVNNESFILCHSDVLKVLTKLLLFEQAWHLQSPVSFSNSFEITLCLSCMRKW